MKANIFGARKKPGKINQDPSFIYLFLFIYALFTVDNV